jgi:hypothetical protein
LTENRAKTDTTGAKAHPTPPNQNGTTSYQSRREDAVSAMGGANTGRSDKDEETNPPEEPRHTTPTTSIETTSSSTRHKSSIHSSQRDPQQHLPGPPSRRATTRTRATTPHNSATRSPSCTGQTARRPRPPHQHPGPPPRPKSQTASERRIDRADNLATLVTQDCHPSHTSNCRTPTSNCHHGSRGRRLDAQTSSAQGRRPDIHKPADERNTHQKLNMASMKVTT